VQLESLYLFTIWFINQRFIAGKPCVGNFSPKLQAPLAQKLRVGSQNSCLRKKWYGGPLSMTLWWRSVYGDTRLKKVFTGRKLLVLKWLFSFFLPHRDIPLHHLESNLAGRSGPLCPAKFDLERVFLFVMMGVAYFSLADLLWCTALWQSIASRFMDRFLWSFGRFFQRKKHSCIILN